MNNIIANIEAAQVKAEVPVFHVGDTVKVYGKIKEGNRERVQVFEGVVLKRQGGGARETFTVRKSSNGILSTLRSSTSCWGGGSSCGNNTSRGSNKVDLAASVGS